MGVSVGLCVSGCQSMLVLVYVSVDVSLCQCCLCVSGCQSMLVLVYVSVDVSLCVSVVYVSVDVSLC